MTQEKASDREQLKRRAVDEMLQQVLALLPLWCSKRVSSLPNDF